MIGVQGVGMPPCSGKMQEDGYPFFLSANNVCLAKNVPVKYLEKIR